jgi:hypothetical protein
LQLPFGDGRKQAGLFAQLRNGTGTLSVLSYDSFVPAILKAHEKDKFQRFETGEESWLALKFRHSTKWSVLRDDIPQKPK